MDELALSQLLYELQESSADSYHTVVVPIVSQYSLGIAGNCSFGICSDLVRNLFGFG